MKSKVFAQIKQHNKELAQLIKMDRREDISYVEFEEKKKEFIKKFREIRCFFNYKNEPAFRYELSKEFRHHHIAFCELRGRLRDEIEKPANNNLANEDVIEKIKNHWKYLFSLENEENNG